MKLAIMQPYFFPYIGYFQLIDSVDEFIVYDKVNFINFFYVSRNCILINKKPYLINVPLSAKSSFKKICDIKIKDDDEWRKKFLLDIYMSYKKAKYFRDVYAIAEMVINAPHEKLSELNYLGIKLVCDYIGITTKISLSNHIYDELEEKLENKYFNESSFPNLKFKNWEQKSVRIVEICKFKKAGVYINTIGGINLYSKEEFAKNDIELKFIKTKEVLYQQFGNEFFPNMSIIDVLMHNGKENTLELIKKYSLV